MKTKIEYTQVGDFHVVRMAGDVRYGDVMSLYQLVEDLESQPKCYLVDLTQALQLDSTALGVLAAIAKQSKALQLDKPVIHVANKIVEETLYGVCFDLVFDIKSGVALTEFVKDIDFHEMGREGLDFNDFCKTITNAHQLLAEISHSNYVLFKDVNDLLGKQSVE